MMMKQTLSTVVSGYNEMSKALTAKHQDVTLHSHPINIAFMCNRVKSLNQSY